MRMFVLPMALCVIALQCCVQEMAVAQPLPTSSSATEAPTLQMRYAEARVRLAELALEKAQEANRKIHNTISSIEMRRLEEQVILAQKQRALARQYTTGTSTQTQLSAARAALRIAEANHRVALEAQQKNAGAFSEILLKEIEARLEIARLRVEIWEDPVYLPTLVDELQWQIDRLTEQVITLSQRVQDLEFRKLPSPSAVR